MDFTPTNESYEIMEKENFMGDVYFEIDEQKAINPI